MIYSGQLGRNSQKMVEYFEVHKAPPRESQTKKKLHLTFKFLCINKFETRVKNKNRVKYLICCSTMQLGNSGSA